MNQKQALLKVVNSDKFLEMSFTTQVLFFRCVNEADEEGIVNCVRALKRLVGASDCNIQELEDKQFILPIKPKEPNGDIDEYIVPVMSKVFPKEGE